MKRLTSTAIAAYSSPPSSSSPPAVAGAAAPASPGVLAERARGSADDELDRVLKVK
jgi:hypothetical protein